MSQPQVTVEMLGPARLHSALPAEPDGRPPVLLVHGAYHGAWCWEHWVDRLTADALERGAGARYARL